jgi:cell division protein FtsZ
MRVSVVATGIDVDPEQYKAPVGNAEKTRSQFARPTAAKPARQATGYFAGHGATAKQSPSKPTNAGYVTREAQSAASADMAINTNTSREPASRPGVGAYPVATDEDEYHPRQPSFVQPHEEESGQEDEQHAGPLFVSPGSGQPSSRQVQERQEHEAGLDDDQGRGSFGIFNRIADVGRSFHSRQEQPPQSQPQPQARTVEIRERQPEAVNTVSAQESFSSEQDAYQDYREHEEESVYDIPAFLRRQSN